jgi:thiol-disulfide isomerase/thioredoxin
MASLRQRWKKFRDRFWLSLLFDATLILAFFLAIHAWQTRDLPVDQPAPATVLEWLDGNGAGSAVVAGKPGIVYFFAPWCFYCRTSIGNLDELVADGTVAWATAVALDYGDDVEVRDFIARTGVKLPVLMGSAQTATDWSIRAFPTYYVIDAEGRISSRAVGYSTAAGMWLRHWLAQ